MDITVHVAGIQHLVHAGHISFMIEEAAKDRGTGIAKRSAAYLSTKIVEGKAVIAIHGNQVVGFCYIETWSHNRYVAHSGLIVHPDFRKTGLAITIKMKVFELSQKKYPNAKIFGITTSMAVMKINSDLGYKPVTFSELTNDIEFWSGCKGCVNYDILQRTNQAHCLCTGMLYKPRLEPVLTDEKARKKRWITFMRFLRFHKIKIKRKLRPAKVFVE